MEYDKKLRINRLSPLHPTDTEKQTYGCRANNPDACANVLLDGICAFASSDCLCKRPTQMWKRQYRELLDEKTEEDRKV